MTRILPTPRWTPLALVAVALPAGLAGQDAPFTGGNAVATQTSPSTLVARLARVWRAYADGRIEQFPYSFPERGGQYSHYGSTYPLPSTDRTTALYAMADVDVNGSLLTGENNYR